ncbi:hypothetical protein BH09PSE1_BH09PSE1_24860 [soil metagenome]
MKTTALIACAALFAASAVPAFAGEAPRAAAAATPTARIVVSLCERDPLTQAAFRSQHGANPVFVTADQVVNARAAGERWSEARCMTASQHQQLTQRLGLRAAL